MKWLVISCIVLAMTMPALAKEQQRKCSMGRDYLLYTPDEIDPNQTYWLVVGVHGASGRTQGACGLADWVKQMNNVIVIAPTFPRKGPWYQVLGGNSDLQLLNLFKELHKEFKLHDKMFIHGFSGGSQYAHRFASKHYKYVIGVSAHSGGTWDESPSAGAASFPWTLSCGLKDTAHSAGAQLTRIEYFRRFYAAMHKGPFTAKPFVTDAAHRPTRQVTDNAQECFRVATTGMFDYQRKATADMTPPQRETWIRNDKQLKEVQWSDGVTTYTLKVNPDGWTVGRIAEKQMARTRRMLDKLAERTANKMPSTER